MSTTKLNLLIVEDDQNLANSLKLMAPDSFKVYIAKSPDLLPDHVFFHAALVDMHLQVQPGDVADGPFVIEKLIKKNPQVEVVAMSGHLDRQLMERSILNGASRFLAKPLATEEVLSVLSKIEAYWNLRQTQIEQHQTAARLIGQSLATENLRKQISQLKGERTSVLIEGETGVGKDVVAQLLNRQEGKTPFVLVNCAALTETLFESEFFGHIKGAFTGADQNKIGFAEAAHGGDLFLDEIEALPLSQQAKLLRFLESGEVRKVGAKEPIHVDVRVIAASNIPLPQLITEKKFREDLFFRLQAHHIHIPTLRERAQDIPEIAEYFLSLAKPKKNKVFDYEALEKLKLYSWPGNIRELRRICEQLILTSPLPIIRATDINQILLRTSSANDFELTPSADGLEDFLTKQEKRFIEMTLKQNPVIEESAARLKISKSNLYKKIKELGIQYE